MESSTDVARARAGVARGGRLDGAGAGEDDEGAEAGGGGAAWLLFGREEGKKKERRSQHPRYKFVNFQRPRYDRRK